MPLYGVSPQGYVIDFVSHKMLRTVGKGTLADIAKQPVERVDMSTISPEEYLTMAQGRVNQSTGSDPEIFVVDGKDTIMPAFTFLPPNTRKGVGGIHKPYPYCDGFAAECYIPASHCHGWVIDHIRDGLYQVEKQAHVVDPKAHVTIQNTFNIPKTVMDAAKDEDVALGCMPSYNVYDDIPQQPANPREFLFRFAGGHVHMGLGEGCYSAYEKQEMIKGADLFAALPAVAFFEKLDDPTRRNFYGRAGEYRTPKHGLEYRVLSNAWLCAPEVAHLVLSLVRCGFKVGRAGYAEKLGISTREIREIINFCDVIGARRWVRNHFDLFKQLLSGDGITSQAAMKNFVTITEEGVGAVIPTYENLAKNWHFATAWLTHSNGDKATWGALKEAK